MHNPSAYQSTYQYNPSLIAGFIPIYYMEKIFSGIKGYINSYSKPSDQDFQTNGYITPQQFMASGDLLLNCGWKWQKATTNPDPLLQPEKQFLKSRGVSQYRMAKLIQQMSKESQKEGFIMPTCQQLIIQESNQLRNYDLFITYDSYYHCPRMWMTGTDSEGKVLNKDQIFQDVMQTSHNQTVTQELFKQLGVRMVTIHPCKHSQVFMMLIGRMRQKKKKVQAKQALFMFLKFLGSIIPTIKYDFTIDLDF